MAVEQALWVWLIFVFAIGASIGSFLNVVIYRLPRDLSLVYPGSQCPKCHKHIRFYDNIPLLSWLILRAKCRYCKTPISPRYFIIELLTGVVFVGLFVLYFVYGCISYFATGPYSGLGAFIHGGWFIYLIHAILLAGLIASSAIDLELWLIPISICWLLTAAGIIAAMIGVYVISPFEIRTYFLLPIASAGSGACAAGAAVGMILSMTLLLTGVIKGSYITDQPVDINVKPMADDENYNHRIEVLREVVFLLPIILCSAGWYYATVSIEPIKDWWLGISQLLLVKGFLGSLLGYFVGAGVVWATRILGTLAFGKEAMGLGDVHLMGAAGAIVGPVLVTVAFFIAPFFGLAWAVYQMFFKKTRQIPYGPFLSLALFAVMILHDAIYKYIAEMFFRGQ
ncbi:MAG: prepilin peptidase [Sedimentisphaerales bacterium]|nr:prepilin peptidase [Sedimentisphaerales bacterium]